MTNANATLIIFFSFVVAFTPYSARALEKTSNIVAVSPLKHTVKKEVKTYNVDIKPIPMPSQHQAYQMAESSKFELVPMYREQHTYQKYDPSVDTIDESDNSSESELISEEVESKFVESDESTNEHGDELTEEDTSFSDVSVTESDSPDKLNGDAVRDPKANDSLVIVAENNEEALEEDPEDEVIPDYEFEDETAESESDAVVLDDATVSAKIRISLENVTDETALDAALFQNDTAVLDFGSGSVSFKASESTAGKGTLVVEFEDVGNLSHDNYNILALKTPADVTLLSYTVTISKKVTPSDTELSTDDGAATHDISFTTDTDGTILSRAHNFTQKALVSYVLQYADGHSYAAGHLDTAVLYNESTVLDFDSAEESFKESSSVAGKGTLSFEFDVVSDLDFNKISNLSLKSDGEVAAEIVATYVGLERKVKTGSSVVSPDSSTGLVLLNLF